MKPPKSNGIASDNKAVVFESALGYNVNNKDKLIKAIRKGLEKYKAKMGNDTQYGQRLRL